MTKPKIFGQAKNDTIDDGDHCRVILKITEFLGRNKIFLGFYCFKNHRTGEASCLGDGKGRTRKEGGPNFSPNLRTQLGNFFQPFNRELYKFIGEEFAWA